MGVFDSLVYFSGYLFLILAAVVALLVVVEKVWLGSKEIANYGGVGWNVRDKVVLITGASSGIGEEFAKQCAKQSAHLILAARRQDKLTEVAKICKDLGAGSVQCVTADVSIESDCKKMCEVAAQHYQSVIDVVFANAGLSMAGNLDKQSDLSLYKTLMDVNFFGVLWTVAYAIPFMKRSTKNPKIIMISSIMGKIVTPGRTGYHASKYAVEGLGGSLRQELYDSKISVLMINPGPVKTEINSSRLGSDAENVGLDMKLAMTTEKCCEMILDAASRHDRNELFTPLQRAGPVLGALVPRTTEMIARMKQKQLHAKPPPKTAH